MNIYIEQMQQINPKAITCDGFDDAIIGIIHNHWNMLKEPIFAYSMRKMVDIIVERDKMDYEEAFEYLEFNTWQAYVGDYSPLFVDDSFGE